MQNIQVWGNLVATSWVVPPFRNLQLQDDVRRLISRIGVGADMSTFSLIRVGNFEHGPKPNHFYVSCRKWTTICGRTQTRAKSYSGTPVDKMSAVWKYFKLESEKRQRVIFAIHPFREGVTKELHLILLIW